MTKYVIGAVGALLTALAGVWLMLAPFALAYQNQGTDWADPTYVDFWTGLPLVVISVAGMILFVFGLVEELRRRGVLRRPYADSAEQQPAGAPTAAPTENADASGSEMERVLLPLVTAMLKDMQERDRNGDHHTQPDSAQQLQSAREEGRR